MIDTVPLMYSKIFCPLHPIKRNSVITHILMPCQLPSHVSAAQHTRHVRTPATSANS